MMDFLAGITCTLIAEIQFLNLAELPLLADLSLSERRTWRAFNVRIEVELL
jgi:hypothetical protein